MWILNIFFSLNLCSGLIFGNQRLNILDKNHVKNYVDSWVNIWRNKPYPLSDLRINEAWKSVILCYKNKYKDNFYCLTFDQNNYFVLTSEYEKKKNLKVVGLLESPDNNYYPNQIEELHNELLSLSNTYNYTLDYSLMKNWSHGFYFYNYQ